MKATLTGKFLLVERDENDPPVVKQPYPRPAKVTPKMFNSWRSDYRIAFDTEALAERALATVKKLGSFSQACVWLDKQ